MWGYEVRGSTQNCEIQTTFLAQIISLKPIMFSTNYSTSHHCLFSSFSPFLDEWELLLNQTKQSNRNKRTSQQNQQPSCKQQEQRPSTEFSKTIETQETENQCSSRTYWVFQLLHHLHACIESFKFLQDVTLSLILFRIECSEVFHHWAWRKNV